MVFKYLTINEPSKSGPKVANNEQIMKCLLEAVPCNYSTEFHACVNCVIGPEDGKEVFVSNLGVKVMKLFEGDW